MLYFRNKLLYSPIFSYEKSYFPIYFFGWELLDTLHAPSPKAIISITATTGTSIAWSVNPSDWTLQLMSWQTAMGRYCNRIIPQELSQAVATIHVNRSDRSERPRLSDIFQLVMHCFWAVLKILVLCPLGNRNIIIIIMGRMGICFTSVATSWWGEACCLLLCFPTGTCVLCCT